MEPDQLDVDFVMLADKAEALNGKLYMVGGGWNQLAVPKFPGRPNEPFNVAIGIKVPWGWTNRKFAFALLLIDHDGNEVGDVLTGQLEQGRPAGMRVGTPQSVIMSIGAWPEFPSEGRYAFKIAIDNEPVADVAFEVVPMVAMQPVSSPEPES